MEFVACDLRNIPYDYHDQVLALSQTLILRLV